MLHFRSDCWSILFRSLWAWSLALSNWGIRYPIILRLSLLIAAILQPLLRLEHLLLLLLWCTPHRCQSLHHLTLRHDMALTIIIGQLFVLQFAIFSSFRFFASFSGARLFNHLDIPLVCIDAVDLGGMGDNIWGVVVAISECRHRAVYAAVADREHWRVVLWGGHGGQIAHGVLAVLSCIESDLVASVHRRD